MKSKFKNQVNQFEDVDFLKHLNLPKNTKRKQTDKVTKQCKKPKQDLTKQDKKQATKRDFVLSRMIKLIPIDSDNDQASWLTDINIDLVLEHLMRSNYNNFIESDLNGTYLVTEKFNFSDDYSRSATAFFVNF